MKAFVMKGYRLGNVPKGYDLYGKRVKDMNFFSPTQKIVINDLGKILQKAWHWKVDEEITDAEIIRRLTIRHDTKMRPQQLHDMWRNPFYCGVQINNLTGWIPIKGHWEAMVSKELFKKVQDIIEGKHIKSKHRKKNPALPLNDIMYCEKCSGKMVGYRVVKSWAELWYYRCQECKGVSINANSTPKSIREGAHEKFVRLLASYSFHPIILEPFKLQFRKSYEYVKREEYENKKIIKQKLLQKEKEFSELRKNKGIGKFQESEEFYAQLKAEYEQQIVDLRVELAKSVAEISNLEELIEKTFSFLSNVSNFWVSNPYEANVELQKVLFPSGIFLDSKKWEYLTPEVNEYFNILASLSKEFDEMNIGTYDHHAKISDIVAREGVEPSTSGL
ncbi:MAG: recombinase family protein [Bacteroidetes bacterium]|nr:recombinase family protein [Bacteroidota bacterium]